MMTNHSQPTSSHSERNHQDPDLPHAPKLPTPKPIEAEESTAQTGSDSPTASGGTPTPRFSPPGKLDPPV